jgi:riboflavin synthase alpha subunit
VYYVNLFYMLFIPAVLGFKFTLSKTIVDAVDPNSPAQKAGLKEGDQVNLERALRVTDRLGGHIVTGHIDGIGIIVEKGWRWTL